MRNKPGILAVGNFDSNVGYAWRLMERLWCEMAKQYGKNNYSMHVCFPTISEVPPCLKENDFQVDRLDFSDRSITGIFQQCKYIKHHSIKVLYLTDSATASIRYALYRLAGVKKIIVHDHTPGLRTKPVPIKAWLKSLWNSIPLVSCSASFAVSPYVERRLIEVNRVPRAKVHCVTNGIDPGPPPRTSSADSDKTVTVVTVSRASYYKGIDFALYVIREVASRYGHQRIKYVLIGDGPDIQNFKNLSDELGLSEITTFTGAVTDVAKRLSNCDIAFHPSKGEAMSLAILEYMRAGLPVVASDNPSVSSSLEHDKYAMIYRESSLESAADAINELLNSPERRHKLGKEARKQLETQFSSHAMNERFIKALRKVLGQ